MGIKGEGSLQAAVAVAAVGAVADVHVKLPLHFHRLCDFNGMPRKPEAAAQAQTARLRLALVRFAFGCVSTK